jgi:hypothetical protein
MGRSNTRRLHRCRHITGILPRLPIIPTTRAKLLHIPGRALPRDSQPNAYERPRTLNQVMNSFSRPFTLFHTGEISHGSLPQLVKPQLTPFPTQSHPIPPTKTFFWIAMKPPPELRPITTAADGYGRLQTATDACGRPRMLPHPPSSQRATASSEKNQTANRRKSSQ